LRAGDETGAEKPKDWVEAVWKASTDKRRAGMTLLILMQTVSEMINAANIRVKIACGAA
jgi:hypothetical protein